MVQRINKNQITNILNDSKKPLNSNSKVNINETDALLQTNYDSIIEAVKQEPIEDSNKVERARQLLLSGQLDTPENIRKAAENIIKFGV